jgi:hypothetical protein
MDMLQLRRNYHQQICHEIISIHTNKRNDQFPNFADGSSPSSRGIAQGIVRQLAFPLRKDLITEQTVGARFETLTRDYLEASFQLLQHLRPGRWRYATHGVISDYVQYEHLAELERIVKANRELASALGSQYIVTPDIVVGRFPASDAEINILSQLVAPSDGIASLTPFREANSTDQRQILHACISCKWTVRSDRAQNVRTEALNLIRHRKGHLPHVVVVTAEPLPMRIAALALGTGDLDCVYHFALPELKMAVAEAKNTDQAEMLDMMINGQRLRDISDLPFDLIA